MSNSLERQFSPKTCVKKTALVFLLIAFFINSKFAPKLFKLMSINTGLKLQYKIEVTSETHVRAGTIISPSLYKVRK